MRAASRERGRLASVRSGVRRRRARARRGLRGRVAPLQRGVGGEPAVPRSTTPPATCSPTSASSTSTATLHGQLVADLDVVGRAGRARPPTPGHRAACLRRLRGRRPAHRHHLRRRHDAVDGRCAASSSATALLGYFDHWSFSDEVGWYKPAPEIFRHALDGLGGVAPERAAHVGDLRRTDVAGARAMGMTAVRYRGVVRRHERRPRGRPRLRPPRRPPGAAPRRLMCATGREPSGRTPVAGSWPGSSGTGHCGHDSGRATVPACTRWRSSSSTASSCSTSPGPPTCCGRRRCSAPRRRTSRRSSPPTAARPGPTAASPSPPTARSPMSTSPSARCS